MTNVALVYADPRVYFSNRTLLMDDIRKSLDFLASGVCEKVHIALNQLNDESRFLMSGYIKDNLLKGISGETLRNIEVSDSRDFFAERFMENMMRFPDIKEVNLMVFAPDHRIEEVVLMVDKAEWGKKDEEEKKPEGEPRAHVPVVLSFPPKMH